MLLREMCLSDYDACRAIWLSSPGVRLTAADSREAVAAFLQRNHGMSFVCLEGDEIIGAAMCGHDGRRGFLYHVAVKPEYWQLHIGTRLVEACLNKLRMEGVDKCHVFVVAENALGRAFWASSWKKREDIVIYSRDIGG
jgi:N-acetylglutamate synthase